MPVLPLLVLLVLLPAGAAHAQAGLTVSPSRIDAVAGFGDELPPIALTNQGPGPVTLRAQPLPASQDPDGLPRYVRDRASVAEGARRFAVAPRVVTVPPGATRRVRLRVTACPTAGQGLYGVVAFDGRVGGGEGTRVTGRLELATTLLVRWPQAGCLDGRVAAARVEQRGERLALVAGVESLGTVHGKPEVELAVQRGDFVVRRARVRGENVLPGAVRDFERLLGRPALPAGRYDLVVRGRFGHGTLRRSARFELVGPNRLAAPALRLGDVRAAPTEPGGRPRLAVTVRNGGSRRGDGEVRVVLSRAGRRGALLERTLAVRGVAAGEARRLAVVGPVLSQGAYAVRAVLRPDDGAQDERAKGFAVRAAPGAPARAADWLLANPAALVGGLAGLLALVAVLAASAGRRRGARRRYAVSRAS